jgi:hypothetical protein
MLRMAKLTVIAVGFVAADLIVDLSTSITDVLIFVQKSSRQIKNSRATSQ